MVGPVNSNTPVNSHLIINNNEDNGPRAIDLISKLEEVSELERGQTNEPIQLRLNMLGKELVFNAWSEYRKNKNQPITKSDFENFVRRHRLDEKFLDLDLKQYQAHLRGAEFIPARSTFQGQSLEIFRRIKQPQDGEMKIVERNGKFFITYNNEEWEVTMQSDPLDIDNVSKRLSLTRHVGNDFYHTYIRRDKFFKGLEKRELQDSYNLNTTEIKKAIAQAKADFNGYKKTESTLKAFDLPKDKPIGYFTLSQEEGYDSILDPTNPKQFSEKMAEALKKKGYDIRFPAENQHFIQTVDPEKALRDNVGALYNQGIRTFYIDMPVHGHRADNPTGSGMEFPGNSPPVLSQQQKDELKKLEEEGENLEAKLLKATTDEEKKNIQNKITENINKKSLILRDQSLLDADETISIINEFLRRDPSCKFVFTSSACYGGGWMEKFKAEAERNTVFKQNVSLFFETSSNQPGIPANYRDRNGEIQNFISHYRAHLIQSLGMSRTYGEAVATAKRKSIEQAEARPKELIGGVLVP